MSFMLDISQAAYSKIERGETELTWRRVYDIAEILEISPFILLPKSKHGSGINLIYRRTLEKFRKFWAEINMKKIEAKRKAYLESQGH